MIPASATDYYTADLGEVTEANYTVEDGYVITSIYATNIAFNSNQTFIMDAYGKIYTITVNSSSFGTLNGWKSFFIQLETPEGQIYNQSLEVLELLAQDYDLRIQYTLTQLDEGIGLDVDIYVYLNPFSIDLIPENMNLVLPYYIAFSEVQFYSTTQAHVEVIYMTTEDYYEIIEEESPSILPQFLTDAVRDLIYSIPYAQEMFLIFSKLYSLFYTFISLFIFIFVDNFLLIFILFESFTLIYASLSRDILQFFSRFAKMHIELFNFVISIIRSIVTTISSIVQALKPT
jgi:hypothetical protein